MYKSLFWSIKLLKNTKLFYNNSTINFIIVHSNFDTHYGWRNRNNWTFYGMQKYFWFQRTINSLLVYYKNNGMIIKQEEVGG